MENGLAPPEDGGSDAFKNGAFNNSNLSSPQRNEHRNQQQPGRLYDDDDEEEECRVCRGPAEEGRPLFKPCKCSGSIGLTHQDCLQSWLQVQRGHRSGGCELCGTPFRFVPQYAEGAPSRLSTAHVLWGLIQRATLQWVPFAIRTSLAISMWLCVAPIVTAYLYHAFMSGPMSVYGRIFGNRIEETNTEVNELSTTVLDELTNTTITVVSNSTAPVPKSGFVQSFVAIAKSISWKLILSDWISGMVVASCIIISFLSMMSFADFLRAEWQQHQQQRDNNDNNINQEDQQQQGRPRGQNRRQPQQQPGAWGRERFVPEPERVPLEDDINNKVWEYFQEQQKREKAAAGVLDNRSFGYSRGLQLRDSLRLAGNKYPPRRIPDEVDDDDDAISVHEERSPGQAGLEENHQNGGDIGMGPDVVLDYSEQLHQIHQREARHDVNYMQDDSTTNDEDHAMHFNHRELPSLEGQRHAEVPQERIVANEDQPVNNNNNGYDVVEDDEEDDDDDDDDIQPLGNAQNQNDVADIVRHMGNEQRRRERMLDLDNQPQDDPVDMDINIALDELLGVRGPLDAVIRNLLWLLLFNAIYIAFFLLMPRMIGHALIAGFHNVTVGRTWDFGNSTLSNPNATVTLLFVELNNSILRNSISLTSIWDEVEAESARHNTMFRLRDLVAVTVGYLCCALFVLFLRSAWIFSERIKLRRPNGGSLMEGEVQRHDGIWMNLAGNDVDEVNRGAADIIDDGFGHDAGQHPNHDGQNFGDEPVYVAIGDAIGVALDALIAIVKVGVLLFLKMFILPILLGTCLDAAVINFIGGTAQDRFEHAGRDLFSFLLLHWVLGITFMLLVTVSVLQMREVMHPELLAQVIRPQEPQPDLLGNLMHESVGTHAKRMLLSLAIYAILLALHAYLPVRWIVSNNFHHSIGLFRLIVPLKFAYILSPQLQVPLELLIFHLCMLAMLEKYKNGLGEIQHYWFKLMARTMGLTQCLLPCHVHHFEQVCELSLHHKSDDNPTSRAVDPLWYELAKVSERERVRLLESRLRDELAPSGNASERKRLTGDCTDDGYRVLHLHDEYIRLPPSSYLESTNHLYRHMKKSRSILLPTRVGPYRLSTGVSESEKKWSLPVIEVWEEVPGDPIARPPEGWDDLGIGGAEEQGRWAWGGEKMSVTERGVAYRRPLFSPRYNERGGKRDRVGNAIKLMKVISLMVFSWCATTVLVGCVLAAPLAAGRILFALLRVPEDWIHDPLGFALGIALLFPIVRAIARAVVFSDVRLFQRVLSWLALFRPPPYRKVATLAASAFLWFFMAPLLLGILYDVALFGSFAHFLPYSTTETQLDGLVGFCFSASKCTVDPQVFGRAWAVGSILLYEWSDLCIAGILTRRFRMVLFEGRDEAAGDENGDEDHDEAADNGVGNRGAQGQEPDGSDDTGADTVVEHTRRLSWQGENGRMALFWGVWKAVVLNWEWDKVDRVVLLNDCAWPVTVALVSAVLPPLALELALAFCQGLAPGTSTVLVRAALLSGCSLQVASVWREQMYRWYEAAHKAARDDLYLIGEVLLNYSEARSEPN